LIQQSAAYWAKFGWLYEVNIEQHFSDCCKLQGDGSFEEERTVMAVKF